MEPTSEQELKQLLDEDRITEKEYKELKQAMVETTKMQSVEQEQGENKSNSVHKLGKIALVLTLCGIILPVSCYFLVDTFLYPPNAGTALWPWFFLFWGMELAGFVMGIISWKNGFGKAAAITAGILLLLSVLFIA